MERGTVEDLWSLITDLLEYFHLQKCEVKSSLRLLFTEAFRLVVANTKKQTS